MAGNINPYALQHPAIGLAGILSLCVVQEPVVLRRHMLKSATALQTGDCPPGSSCG